MYLQLNCSLGGQVSWTQWLLFAFPALILFSLGMYAALYLLFHPGKSVKSLSVDVIRGQIYILGPLSKTEKITLLVSFASIGMLISQPWHQIDNIWIMMIAFSVLLISGALSTQNFKQDLDWGFLFFIGISFSFAEVASNIGLVQSLGHIFVEYMGPFMESAYLFLFAVAVISFLTSFFIKDDPALILLVLTIAPLSEHVGVHPWVVIFTILTSLTPFFFPYQSPTYLAAYYGSDGKTFTHKDGQLLSLSYMVISVLAILLSIPFWKWLGLL
jgi:di/tricarboxylate transporter